MSKLWLIQLFWLALAVPGYAVLRRWDPTVLRRGFLGGLGHSYLASLMLLTPISVLGYIWQWPLWTLSASYVAAVVLGLIALVPERGRLRRARLPTLLAAVGGALICLDLWLGLRSGAHVQGDAGYHIARIRMLLSDGLNNWDPIVSQRRLDLIYHTNLYHALIAASAQLSGSDPALAWLATWPFAKLLTAAGAFQLARVVFGSHVYGWLASVSTLATLSPYSVLPFPNTLAPMALLPMGLAAALSVLSARRSARPAAWLAASGVALAEVHALNAAFLVMVVGPCLLAALLFRVVRRRPAKRVIVLGLLACGASLPWLIVAGAPRIEAMVRTIPAFQGFGAKAAAAPPAPPTPKTRREAAVKAYKAEHFRKLSNGHSVYDPEQLRGSHDLNLAALAVLAITLALRPRTELWWLAAFVSMTCAWLLLPPLCSLLLAVTGAPWAAVRFTQVLAVVALPLLAAAPLSWLARLGLGRRAKVAASLVAMALGLWLGFLQQTYGEPWTMHKLRDHARSYYAKSEWQKIQRRRQLLCPHIPTGETVMAHPRWDYGLPMHCRSFAVALAPPRGWHGLPYMRQRRKDVEEFFEERTTGERRLSLMRKYATQHVYTTNRLARRIVASLPGRTRVLAGTRQGAVVFIDL